MTSIRFGVSLAIMLAAGTSLVAAGTQTTYVVQRGDYDCGAASDDVVMSDEVVRLEITDGPAGRPVVAGVTRFGGTRLWNQMARRIVDVQTMEDRVDVTVHEEGGRFRETYSLGGVLVERVRLR